MKYFYCCLILFVLTINKGKSQDYPIVEYMRAYTIEELEVLAEEFGLPPGLITFTYDLDVWKVTYETPDPLGDTTIATGALVIPKEADCFLPLASYQHGTVARKDRVPSAGSDELQLGLLYASNGYIVSMPDYLGLGDSPGMHPYVHARSQATASVDLIRVSIQIAAEEGVNWNEQLFLYGYSQGGHATMATHLYIQEELSDEFTVTASNPMSGPYDISGVQAEVVVSNEPYSTPAYLPYVLFGYQRAYPNLFTDPSEILRSPYDEILPPLFDGTHSLGEINAVMPAVPNRILVPSVLDSFINDPNHRLRVALRDNDVYDWTPTSPIRMSYCTADEQVDFNNAIVAYNKFIENGAVDIVAVNMGSLDHFGCASPALLGGLFYFNSFKSFNNGMSIVSEQVYDAEGGNNGAIAFETSGGIPPLSYTWSNLATGDSISGLAPGPYTVTITDASGCSFTETYEIDATTSTSGVTIQPLQISPNPAQHYFYVNLPLSQATKGSLNLYDIHGRQVYHLGGKLEQRQVIPAYQLPAGWYVVEWKTANDRAIGKVLITR